MSSDNPSKRRKRFVRDTNPKPIKITDRDCDIFRMLHEHRILRTRHIVQLTGASRVSMNRRLELLYDNKYIQRINPKQETDYEVNSDMLHVLDSDGASFLHAKGERASPYSDVNRKAGRDHVSHTLLTSDYMVAVQAACTKTDGKVRYISTEEILAGTPRLEQKNPLKVTASVPNSSGAWVSRSTVPDGLFGLHLSEIDKTRYFFFEADRGTMPQDRKKSPDMSAVKGKYKVYYEYWRSLQKRGSILNLGFKNFQILFLTDKGERRALIANKEMQTVKENRRTWFFSYKQHMLASEADILTTPWIRGDGEPDYLTRIEKKHTP